MSDAAITRQSRIPPGENGVLLGLIGCCSLGRAFDGRPNVPLKPALGAEFREFLREFSVFRDRQMGENGSRFE